MLPRMLGGLAAVSLLWVHSGTAAESPNSPTSHFFPAGDSRTVPVTVIRGSPSPPSAAAASDPAPTPQIVQAGVVGTGNNLWYLDAEHRIHACWLSGTGYVNSLRVVCTP
ncbi:MAG: hypothetical protein U1E66_03975 [Rhodospirillales bacterium]